MNLEAKIIWPAVDPKVPRKWLWSARQDVFWIIGGASLLFAALTVPITLAVPSASSLLIVGFLHLGAVCNYPHYAITYRLIVDERTRARSSYLWLLATIPLVPLSLAFGAYQPVIIAPLVRIYLTWSAYHYAAQHFGIASMYQARDNSALDAREKRALQVAFCAVALHLMLLINTHNGLGSENMLGVVSATSELLLPISAYPIAVVAATIGVASYGLAEAWHKRRRGKGLGGPARLLFATNFVWFVLPFVHLPGRDVPWGQGTLSEWVPFALPFFHCAQYLGICGWRARTSGPIKPVFYFAILVVVGLALFEGIGIAMESAGRVKPAQVAMLVPAVLNIHHFFLDGLMWKARRRPTAIAASVGAAPAGAPAKAA